MFVIANGESNFTQWEQGQKLINEHMTTGQKVIFNSASGGTTVMYAYNNDGTVAVNVPNKLLQSAGTLVVDLDGFAECKTFFNVEAAEKPVDYVLIETDPCTPFSIDPRKIKDMYYEETIWSPLIDPTLGRFTDTALANAYVEYENGGSLKAVINGVDYTDFIYTINSKGFSISVNGTDFVYTANMMNGTNSHNAESWEWYTEVTTIHYVPSKYLPTPYVLDDTKYGSSAIPTVVGNELLENLLTGVQTYVYDGKGYNPIVRFEVNSSSSGGVTTYALVIYYGKAGSAGVTFTSKYITINKPNI